MRECAADRSRRPASPRLVLRRVLVLAEGRQYREAAAALKRLGGGAVAAAARELPLDLLADGLPHSAQLLDEVFQKLISSGQRPNVNAEQVVWQLVKLFSCHNDPTLKTKVARLVKTLLDYQPDFQRLLSNRKKSLEQAVQGLGCHGLTQDASGLTHLHVALKNELQRHIEAYKTAVHTLEDLRLTEADNKKPVDSSHQRLLSLRHSEVQQRLIDNKTLLTLLDKQSLKQLAPLVDTLAARVQSDKEALFCISQIKRLCAGGTSTDERPVATQLMAWARGCATLLQLTRAPDSPCPSDIGYHSGTDHECAQQDRRQDDDTGRFATLYYECRPRVLEALGNLPDLTHASQLKAKIIFSVVVLSFRTCRSLRESRIREVFHLLGTDASSSFAQSLRAEAGRCLRASADFFPLVEAERQVLALVCDTLKEYRCLEGCAELRRFVSEATRVAWRLVTLSPPYDLDTEFQTPGKFHAEKHQRHHSADRASDAVTAYLWPALFLEGTCVFKAVVIT